MCHELLGDSCDSGCHALPTPKGYGGLVKVSEEHLAQQVQELTQRHLAARQAAVAAVRTASGEPPCMTSPFAAEPGPGADGGGAAPLLPPQFRAAIARAGGMLERGEWGRAGAELRTALAAVPLHGSEALEAAVDVAYDCTPGETPSPGPPQHRPRLGIARQELQQALAFLRRCACFPWPCVHACVRGRLGSRGTDTEEGGCLGRCMALQCQPGQARGFQLGGPSRSLAPHERVPPLLPRRRNEPRRALAVLRSAAEALQGEREGPDAFCVALLADFIRSKRHV